MIALPRLKPYSFTAAILPVYFLTKGFRLKSKILTIGIVSLLPLASYISMRLTPENTLTQYSQLTGLMMFFAYYFFKERMGKKAFEKA